MHTVHTPDALTLRFDPLLSKEFCDQVQDWLSKQERTQQTYIALLKQFSAIKTVQVRYNIAGKLVAQLHAVCPFVQVNTTWLLTTDAKRVPLAAFDADAIAELSHMQMRLADEQTQLFDQQTLQAVHALVTQCSERFALTWLDETRIWFKDMQQPQWNILGDVHHVPQAEVLQKYAAVVEAMQAKNIKNKKGYAWVADMRFADQIIVYGTKGVENEATK